MRLLILLLGILEKRWLMKGAEEDDDADEGVAEAQDDDADGAAASPSRESHGDGADGGLAAQLIFLAGGREPQELFCTSPWPRKLARDFICLFFVRKKKRACVILFILRDFKGMGGL